jgi:hypothetical protein
MYLKLPLTFCFTKVLEQKVNDFIRVVGGRNSNHGVLFLLNTRQGGHLWRNYRTEGELVCR